MANQPIKMIQQRWNSFWQDRTVREQRLLLVVGWLIFIGSVFFGVIDPAISGRQYWQHMLPVLRTEHAQMQQLANQLNHLQTEQRPNTPALDRTTIERSLTSAGLTPRSLQLSDRQLQVAWATISFSALIQWLQTMQREHAWSVLEAHISASDSIDRVDAKLTMQLLR